MGIPRQYANDFDQSTTVAVMLGRPTYADFLNLPDHTEACVVWEDGQADAYDIALASLLDEDDLDRAAILGAVKHALLD